MKMNSIPNYNIVSGRYNSHSRNYDIYANKRKSIGFGYGKSNTKIISVCDSIWHHFTGVEKFNFKSLCKKNLLERVLSFLDIG